MAARARPGAGTNGRAAVTRALMTRRPGIGVLTTDADLRVRSWNDWLASATGLPEARRSAAGPLDRAVRPGPTRPGRDELLDEVVGTGTTRVLAPAFHHYLIPCPPREPSPHFDRDAAARDDRAAARRRATIVGAHRDHRGRDARGCDANASWRAELQREPRRRRRPARRRTGRCGGRRSMALRRRGVDARTSAHLLETLQRDHHELQRAQQRAAGAGRRDVDVTAPLVDLLSARRSRTCACMRRWRSAQLRATGRGAGADRARSTMRTPTSGSTRSKRSGAWRAGGGRRRWRASPSPAISSSRFPAIDALARIDDPRVVPRAGPAAGRRALRPAVVDALARLGDEDVRRRRWCAILNDDATATAPVAAALARIHARYEEAITAPGRTSSIWCATAITPDGRRQRSPPPLGAARRRRCAPLVVVLGWVGRPRARRALIGACSASRRFRHRSHEAVVGIGSAAVGSADRALGAGRSRRRRRARGVAARAPRRSAGGAGADGGARECRCRSRRDGRRRAGDARRSRARSRRCCRCSHIRTPRSGRRRSRRVNSIGAADDAARASRVLLERSRSAACASARSGSPAISASRTACRGILDAP